MNRAVFLDRDGVINAAIWNPVEGKLDSPYRLEEVKLLPGAARAIREISQMGFLAVVVSNQPGVAKGKCDHTFLEAVDAKIIAELAQEGARLDGVYYCLHHPQAQVDDLRLDCDCRKPRPGLLLEAAQELKIDLTHSYMLGDSDVDIQAGLAAGCYTILIDGGRPGARISGSMSPHPVAPSLLAAVKGIWQRGGE